MQLELLDKPDLSRAAARRRAMDDARARADEGMGRATDRADRADPDWTVRALVAVRQFAASQAKGVMFTVEQMRLALELGGLAKPADGRAWGTVTRSAVDAGYIERIRGMSFPAASSNGAEKPVYRRGAKA